jgi:protein SCO1/2
MFASADFKAISKNLHSDTSEEQIIEFVQAIKDIPSQNMLLVPLLAERHALYKNKGANQVSRLRGYILSTFEKSGLPDEALPFVLEDLENSRSAYVVAAAAKALRGIKSPTVQVVPYLLKAIINMRYIDDAVTFETYKPQWPLENYTFALKEICITFQWLGAYAKGALDELGRLIDEDALPLSFEITTEIKKAIRCITEDQREVNICCELPPSGEALTGSTTCTEQIGSCNLRSRLR